MTNGKIATQKFTEHFGEPPTYLVRAPGRVNLIGEHTDYNLGFSIPMAINRAIWIALRPRNDERVWLRSIDFPEPASFSLERIMPVDGWANYVHGMAWALIQSGYALGGWEGILASDIPVASGLSSSAALEIGVARTFWAISRWDWDSSKMARVCNLNDHQWMGIKSGALDQLISAIGQQGKAFLIDFQDLSYAPVSLPESTVVVVLDTKVNRGLLDSAYNTRVAECQQAADYFGVKTLREISIETFEVSSNELKDPARRRARHVITENSRTLEAAEWMRSGDPRRLGALMTASHISLRDDFEVSCDELNLMVDLSLERKSCFGARMTGAGFGGCAVALVDAAMADDFSEEVARQYADQTGLEPDAYVCLPAGGAEVF